jgi:hypothetical protein
MSRKKLINIEPLAQEVKQALVWQFQNGLRKECPDCLAIVSTSTSHTCVNRLPAVRQVTKNSIKNRVFGVRATI